MSQAVQFTITEFTNPSGEIVYRVSGWLDGKRIRKNFPSRAEASAEKQALAIQRIQSETGVRTTTTRLTDEQLHEAEAAFRRIAGKPRPLSFYLDYALANYCEPESQKPLSDAIEDYKQAKAHEHEQGHISAPQLARIGWDLKRLDEHFPKRAVAELTLPAIVAFLETGRPGMKTYSNRRGIVSTFFKYAFHRGWIAENPIPKVPHYRIRRKRGAAVTFSTAHVAELMEHFETHEGGRWIPYFALCLFAGIRPGVPDGEITKVRPKGVNLDTGIITISADTSKVREPRRDGGSDGRQMIMVGLRGSVVRCFQVPCALSSRDLFGMRLSNGRVVFV